VYQRVFQLISTAIPLLCIWRIQSATELCITLELQDHRIDISPAFDQPNSLLSRALTCRAFVPFNLVLQHFANQRQSTSCGHKFVLAAAPARPFPNVCALPK